MVQPEFIIFAGATVWALAGVTTGIPENNVPSGFPALFFMIATIGGMIGVTEVVPERIDAWLTLLAAVLFVVTPVAFTFYLLQEYPPDGMKGGVAPGAAEDG